MRPSGRFVSKTGSNVPMNPIDRTSGAEPTRGERVDWMVLECNRALYLTAGRLRSTDWRERR